MPTPDTDTSRQRRAFAEYVVKRAGSTEAGLVEAFASVPREHFVGAPPWRVMGEAVEPDLVTDDPRQLYQDALVALAPERHINNGQPSLHALCLTAAAPRTGETVVQVGAGTGYYAAILSLLVGPSGRVLALEREPDLAARAQTALLAYPNVQVLAVSTTEFNFPPCDLIYVNAGASHPLPRWLDALRFGGRLVFPLTGDDGHGLMLLVTRRGEHSYAARALTGVSFVPCAGVRDDAHAGRLRSAMREHPASAIRSLRRATPPDGSAWHVGEGWWLSCSSPA